MMDKLTKKIRCNPDGTLLIKRWDDRLVVKGKTEEGAPGMRDIRFHGQEESTGNDGYNWETELDYY